MSELTSKQRAVIQLAQYAEKLSETSHHATRVGVLDCISIIFREDFPDLANAASIKAALINETERKQLDFHLLFDAGGQS